VQLVFPAEGAGTELARQELAVATARYGPTVMPASLPDALAAPARLARQLGALRRSVRAARPDVVLVATAYLPHALLAARLEGVPTVLYAAELLGAGVRRGPSAGLGSAAFRRAARGAAAVVACSEWVARQYPDVPRLEVLPPGIGSEAPVAAELPGTPPRIAVVGALSRGRGQDVAVDALELIRAEISDATLLVAGEPHPRRADRTFAAELRSRAGPGVRFLGSVTAIGPLLAAADVVVVPNRVGEGFGRVAFEAAAAGTPVVATPLTAAARLLPEGDLLVVEPERPELLAQAVLRLLDDPALAASLTQKARAWVGENLDESALAARFAETVRSVASYHSR
jgi:glycosyltransferase involved in cell wall biosynthesis